MLEQKNVIPPPEKRLAEGMMSERMKKQSEVRAQILGVSSYLLAAGVSEELINEALNKAEKIIEEKFTSLEKEDPLALLSGIYGEVALTEDEKAFFEEQHKRNQDGMQDSMKEYKNLDVLYFTVLDRKKLASDLAIAGMNNSIAERILSKLRVLEEGKNLTDFIRENKESLPKSAFAQKAPHSYFSDHPTDDILTNLQTSLPGIYIDVWVNKKDGQIHINGKAIESALKVLKEIYS
ncbi:MAG: hypothetical protein WC726_03250 [Parcubacteria group bacterium]|jgi:hypothetical protein